MLIEWFRWEFVQSCRVLQRYWRWLGWKKPEEVKEEKKEVNKEVKEEEEGKDREYFLIATSE